MGTMSGWTCLIRGHEFRPVTHRGSAYQYCLRCGKVILGHEGDSACSERGKGAEHVFAEAGSGCSSAARTLFNEQT